MNNYIISVKAYSIDRKNTYWFYLSKFFNSKDRFLSADAHCAELFYNINEALRAIQNVSKEYLIESREHLLADECELAPCRREDLVYDWDTFAVRQIVYKKVESIPLD